MVIQVLHALCLFVGAFKQRDGLPDPKGSLACHSFAGYIHGELRSEGSDDRWQEARAVQEVQPGGAVSDRSIRLRPWRGSSVIASKAASSHVSLHFLTHGTGNTLKNFR